MTCIVGLVNDGKVWLGGDSLAHAGCTRYPPGGDDTKVFRLGDMLMGVAGSSRMVQILRYFVTIPEHPDTLETFSYLVTRLTPAIRQAVSEHDGAKINDSSDGWQILLGYQGGLYEISHDLCVSVFADYTAVGCGSDFAMGSLCSTYEVQSASERLHMALLAAARHDVHVAPPFVIEAV